MSASDLANHLACRHLTALDLAVARGERTVPGRVDPALAVLQQRGFEHEQAYLDHLRTQGRAITALSAEIDSGFFEQTLAAMRSGADVIVQAALRQENWLGRADVLLRVDRASRLGQWSYEVVDCKLARQTRAGTILQLCLYSEILGEIQGCSPEFMQVVTPGCGFEPVRYRIDDFLAYHRLVKQQLLVAVDRDDAETYPDPAPHCDICRWWPECDRRRRQDDHLCLVAGISKLQTRELQSGGVNTLRELAQLPIPLRQKPKRGSAEGYVRIREQARVQWTARTNGAAVYELLPPGPERGLARLPEPSPGDMFLDLEGDPYVADAGLEYLVGYATADGAGNAQYERRWATTREQERAAFEWVVDRILDRWQQFPEMHVYHFAPYEPGALKRLMGRYASREAAIDRLLRSRRFVDLHTVVRQAVRAGIERYSLKELEIFCGFEREMPLREAAARKHELERALELSHPERIEDVARETVEVYNRDDCVSAMRLRDWLEGLRAECVRSGLNVPRPAVESGDPSETVNERQRQVEALAKRLTADIPAEAGARSAGQKARWLLAGVLDYHRREDKAAYWEYFRLLDLDEEDYLDEKSAISGLRFLTRVEGTAKCPIDRYAYAKQETDVRARDKLYTKVPNEAGQLDPVNLGKVVAMDLAARTVEIKKTQAARDLHPCGAFADPKPPNSDVLADALLRIGDWVAGNGVDHAGPYRAGRDLILGLSPRLGGNQTCKAIQRESPTAVDAAKRLAVALDAGVLPIQGPPGSGKTFTGARMICELVRAGKRVGVTALSHKVIENLLAEVVRAAQHEGLAVACVQRVKERAAQEPAGIRQVTANPEVVHALLSGQAQVAGGTAWLWAPADLHEAVDVLFVDEAGQMPLATVLAASQSARSLVLIGDPAQLDQPQQGSHPEGTGVSALQHLLGDDKTLPADRGLFLRETWRLHPQICRFTSEVFYEGKLQPRTELDRQALIGPTPFRGAGLWYVPVAHDGNRNSAPEEVDQVAALVDSLTHGQAGWINAAGEKQPLTLRDILIVAPYNAQVSDLLEKLPEGARAGTVDKFQGQEAPVVIYSMTTSSPEEAPRGMEFLFSLNRLNVATSRARCVCILVANPSLFEPDCRTPRQMQLTNALCRYRELAQIPASGPPEFRRAAAGPAG